MPYLTDDVGERGPDGVHVVHIPPGDRGSRAALHVMERLAHPGPHTRHLARRLLAERPARFPIAHELRPWLSARTIFVLDPPDADLVRSAETLARDAIESDGRVRGDCDCVAVLASGLAQVLGLRSRYVAVALEPGGPYTHVWTEVLDPVGGLWVELDVTREAQGLPTQPPIYRRLIHDVHA